MTLFAGALSRFAAAGAALSLLGCSGTDPASDGDNSGTGGAFNAAGGSGDPSGGSGGTPPDGASGGTGAVGGTGGDSGRPTVFPSEAQIATNNAIYCTIVDARTVCWGTGQLGQTSFPELDQVLALSSDSWIRALTANGTVYQLEPNVDPAEWQVVLTGVSRLADDFLFVRADGSVVDGDEISRLPDGLDAATQAGGAGFNLCFIRESDSAIVCGPGDDTCGVPAAEFAPPPGAYRSLDPGAAHFCAIADDDSVVCWGGGTVGPDTPAEPDGFCPLHGSNVKQGQDQAPAGSFSFVSAGPLHSCGVRTDGTVACWGAGTTADDCTDPVMACGQSVPPSEGGFVQVATGYSNTCGLKEDGSVVCWGADTGGRSTPPPELSP